MQPYLYDVYAKDGSLLISEMTSRQIADALGVRKMQYRTTQEIEEYTMTNTYLQDLVQR